jgi:periplasmic mercuric ion binding protein
MAPSILKAYALLASLFLAPIGAFAGEPRQTVLDVPGMNCSLCPVTVKKALQRVPGFIDAQVDLDAKRAVIKYDSEKVTPDRLATAVTNAGFPATVAQK